MSDGTTQRPTHAASARTAEATETFGRIDSPAVLMIGGGGAGDDRFWRQVAAALAEAGRHVRRVADVPDGSIDAGIGALRTLLNEPGSRPVVLAVGAAAPTAAIALGEGTAPLATGLVLVDPVADDPRARSAAAGIGVPTLIVRHGDSRDGAFADAPGDAERVAGDAAASGDSDAADALSAVLIDFLERRVPRDPPEYRAGSDPRTLRDALGCFATGVTVVTTIDGQARPVGLTANSFTSVSLDPPLLLVCIANSAGSLPAFVAAPHFAVNVLHIGQQPVSGRFAARGEDRFADTPCEAWETGVPIIANSLASFECARDAVHVAGDHHILIGRVLRVRFEPRRDPLLYFRGRYRRLHFA